MPPLSVSDNNDEAYDGSPQGVITEIQVVDAFVANDVKVTVDTTKIPDSHPMVDEARPPSVSTIVEQVSDAASIHSAATVHVTESSSPPSDGPEPERTIRSPPSSPTRSNPLHDEPHQRHRETRPSNRFSGFFSNFIRRDPTPFREPVRDGASRLRNASPNSQEVSRPSSPPPVRATTPPPPPLPAPTLQELGLSLSAITTDLCPSHFTSPPSSGAFLPPNYLLLCHPQGLDVLPLISPPAIQPYALVRRVNFKSVVVMEQRGVLVAIAGRRDGVRVYALEEIKRAIEWRMEVEVRREKERQRRENAKRTPATRTSGAYADIPDSKGKSRNSSISSFLPGQQHPFPHLTRKHSQHNSSESHSSTPPVPLIPRSATRRTAKRHQPDVPTGHPHSPPHTGQPPPYPHESANPPTLERQQSYVSLSARPSSHLVNNVLAGVPTEHAESSRNLDDAKSHWADFSDEEAIDAVAAGPSGSHLDERTSATLSASGTQVPTSPRSSDPQPIPVPVPSRTSSSTHGRRPRPANLNLTPTPLDTIPPPSPSPSPAPSLLSLRRALSHLSPSNDNASGRLPNLTDVDDDDNEVNGQITLAQALMESRLPDIPPIGTIRPQEAILITPNQSIRSSQVTPTPSTDESIGRSATNRRQRRWSFVINNTTPDHIREPPASAPAVHPESFSRSQRSVTHPMPLPVTLSHNEMSGSMPQTSRSSRFLPRILSNVLNGRASEDRPSTSASLPELSDGSRWTSTATYQVPPPKLEYVKLPGTKGAVLIKAVETPKKSFLAILCGDHGEKVELFAGTYRTALGLSRTFILPDSPRSLELQLQGDDLVEVFLVFAQNVFGLEPATVRVREVRIGRAERRAARRRARENRLAERGDPEQEEETNVNISIGVSVSVAGPPTNAVERPQNPPAVTNDRPEEARPTTSEAAAVPQAPPQAEDVLSTMALMGAYTTFQQLGFAPRFPLASIADEYVIPPTYPDFLEYKSRYEVEGQKGDVAAEAHTEEQAHFTPPGLPVPTPAAPSRWFYRDPKNVVHGPWKASLMQAWYKDGLLPPDLPIRREEDAEFILLGELRLRCIDPTQPFRNAPLITPPSKSPRESKLEKPLLSPISLLTQPKHFGPPALFYSSRGGHSTAIVDSRGRSVLKGKFFWSNDDDTKLAASRKLGDIKRLEAFDISERSLLVAFRRVGLEVVDLGDALLKPADESRTNLPNYMVPLNAVGRRAPFVWKIGHPLSSTFALVNGVSVSMKGKATFGYSSNKKSSISSTKNMNGRADSNGTDPEADQQDVLFLGRSEDDVYFCERNISSFRIIRLSPIS